jgi:ssRNA-specific RNase YbeY (16S rRNA maturation enzyme)
VLGALDHVGSELSLSLVPDDEMAQLNAAHRGIAAPTDVLSFSLLEGAAAVHQRQASRGRRSIDDELARLLIHGVLHLVGHDHARPHEALVMRREERRLWRTACADGATRGGVTLTRPPVAKRPRIAAEAAPRAAQRRSSPRAGRT